MLVKSRKVGNSIAITIPREINIHENESYFITKDENGIIFLIPKIENVYQTLEDGALYQHDLLEESQEGKEII